MKKSITTRVIDLDSGNIVAEFTSLQVCAKLLNYNKSTVYRAVLNRRKLGNFLLVADIARDELPQDIIDRTWFCKEHKVRISKEYSECPLCVFDKKKT